MIPLLTLFLKACTNQEVEAESNATQTNSPEIPDDCFRSIYTDECMEVPHEEDGMHSLCENDLKKENKDCFVMVDNKSVHIIDYRR